MLYCRFCQDLHVLRKNFWEKFLKKLPSEVSIPNLMLNWNKLQPSLNNIGVLGCILPDKANEIAILNSRRFIQHPIEHWDSFHKDLVRCVFIFICMFLFWLLSSEILSRRTWWGVLLFLFASYLFIEQWNTVHKDLVTVFYSCLHLFLNVVSLAKDHSHPGKSKRKTLRKSLYNESNFEFMLLCCFRSTQNH